MKKTLNIPLLALTLMPFASQAIGIDSMLKIAEGGKTDFTVMSNASYREFIQVGISSIGVQDGELTKLAYSRENVDKWSLLVRPSRSIVEPGGRKLFQVEFDPAVNTDLDKDNVYQVAFIPTPYFAEGEPVTHTVQVAMGFAPIVIVPAKKDRPIQYHMQYSQEGLSLKNNGETYLRTVLDACGKDVKGVDRKDCTAVVYALSGRQLPITLTAAMKAAPEIKVELSTHNSDYKESFTLKPGQSSRNDEG